MYDPSTDIIDYVNQSTLGLLIDIRERCAPRTENSADAVRKYYADMTLMLADFIQKDESPGE